MTFKNLKESHFYHIREKNGTAESVIKILGKRTEYVHIEEIVHLSENFKSHYKYYYEDFNNKFYVIKHLGWKFKEFQRNYPEYFL